MKKIYLLFITVLFVVPLAHAQWTTSGSNTTTNNNVGVGTTTPQAPLDVYAGSGNSLTTGLNITGGTGGTSAGTSLKFISAYAYPSSPWNMGSIGAISSGYGTNYGGSLVFYTNPGNTTTSSNEVMRITSSGNIGIGTTSPLSTAKLDVSGSVVFGASGSRLSLSYDSFGFNRDVFNGNIFNSGGYAFQFQHTNSTTQGADYLALQVYNGSGVNITPNALAVNGYGNVGIGTATPGTYKLAVNGNIHAQQVNIDLTGWPDYVFNRDYSLEPLPEVKAYIKQNRHLPGVPSEQEMVENGLDVGEMNKLLMKKMEELTLYMIELKEEKEKRENEQEGRIKKLEQEVELLLKKK